MRRFAIFIIVACSAFAAGIVVSRSWHFRGFDSTFTATRGSFITLSSSDGRHFLSSQYSHASETAQKKDSSVVERREDFKVIIPKETWEPIFFREIDERANIAKLPRLRHAALPKDDLETRLWIGFGLTALRGFVLKRSAGQWTGIYIQGIHPRLPRSEYEITLRPPKSGWEGLWQRLLDQGLLSLPDAGSIGCRGSALDGMSYVAESNIDNTYRTYMYDNPQYAKCKEAKQMIEIVNIFEDEFGPQLERYRVKARE